MGSAKEDAVAPPLVGHYRLLGELGRDVLGVAHLACPASAREFPKWAVVRRVHPGVARDVALTQAFLAATRVALRVVHPNVAATFDCGPRDRPPWVAREHIAGESILDVVQHSMHVERPPWALAGYIVAEAALGLEGIRMRMPGAGPPIGFITGAAPPYIVISFAGEVKIIDGCMPLIEGRPMIDSAALPYLPSGLAGEPLEDTRPHVFGLGVVLWELVAGRRLFLGETDDETLRLVEARVVPLLRNVAPAAAPLEDIILRALGKSADSFANVSELERALRGCLDAQPERIGRDDLSRFMRGAFGRQVTEQKTALDDAWAIAQVTQETEGTPEWAPVDIDTSVSARFSRPEETALTHLAPRRTPSVAPPPPPMATLASAVALPPLPPPPRVFEDTTLPERGLSPLKPLPSPPLWRASAPLPTLPDIPDEVPTGEVTVVRPGPSSFEASPPSPRFPSSHLVPAPAISAPRINYLPDLDEPDLETMTPDQTPGVPDPPPWPPVAPPRTVSSQFAAFPAPVPAPEFPEAERDPYFTPAAPAFPVREAPFLPDAWPLPTMRAHLPLPTPPPGRASAPQAPTGAWTLRTPEPVSPRSRPLPVVPLHSSSSRPSAVVTERSSASHDSKSLVLVAVVAFLGSLGAVGLISAYREPPRVAVRLPPPLPAPTRPASRPTATTPVSTTSPFARTSSPELPIPAPTSTIPVATLDDLPRVSPQASISPDSLPRATAPPRSTPVVVPRSPPTPPPNEFPRLAPPPRPSPPASPTPPPPTPVGHGSGLLSVFCTPACDRVLDGSRSLGPSPVFKAQVSAGVHHLRLKVDSPAAQKDITVTVPENDTTVVRETVGD